MRRNTPLLFALLFAPLALPGQPLVLHQQTDRQPVTEGVELIRIRQLDTLGWLNVFGLEIDHTASHLAFDALLGNDRLTGAQLLSATVRDRGAIAAINGDFFHIRTTGAPVAGHIQSAELFKSPPTDERALSAGIDRDSLPFIGPVSFHGRMESSSGGSRQLDGWNLPAVPANAIIYYNHRWGPFAPGPESADMTNWTGLVHIVVNGDGQVLRLLKGKPGPEVPENGAILLGRGEGATWLVRHAQPGQRLEVSQGFSPETLRAAIGGFPVLVRNGKVAAPPNPADVHPRSAFGYNRDKTRSWFVAVDGRSPLSRGVDLHELGTILRNLGAHHALNLDGGGTTTLIARTPAAETPSIQNIPSDGRERPMPNGLGIFNTAPTGPMQKLFIQPPAPSDQYTLSPGEFRLAPGGMWKPVAFATDRHINRVAPPGPVTWKVTPPELGSFSEDGAFLAGSPGRGEISASISTADGTFQASHPLLVIGPPVRLQVVPAEIVLSPRQETDLRLNAVDARGYVAPLALEDAQWEVRGAVGRLREGRFVAGDETGSGALVARFGQLEGIAPVGIGDRPVVVATFEERPAWRSHSVPPEVTQNLSAVTHPPFIRDRSSALKLAYDFSGTTRTRAAYVSPSGGPLELPGRPLRLGGWVYGDGREAWLRGQLVDGGGVSRTIDFARNVDWTGWRYLEAEIPPGLDFPVSLRSIYVVETRPNVHYSGAVYFDEILAIKAPMMDPAFLSVETAVHDPANRVAQLDAIDEENFRFIVFGDSKLTAGAPASAEAKVLAALIEEINRQEVEFVLFTGDLIEHDTDENYRLGREFLDRLEVPRFMTVANHEIAGTDSYQRYREYFGPTHYHFVRGNSEFIVLNTARPGLRASEPEQWPWLQERLAETEADNLFLLTHTPVIDPMPGGQTGWSDRSEVSLFQRLLTREVEKDRNVYLFHGHVHGFDRRAFDGVQYLTSAGAGSSLYLPPHRGGFFHFVIVTVKGKEITYQVIPLLERIELAETVEAKVDETVELPVYGVAPGDLVRFPLRYPAAVEWTVTDPAVARVDPANGILHGIRAGETEIQVRSGGVSTSTRVKITP